MRRLLLILFGFVAAMLAAAVCEVLFAMPPAELAAMDQAARTERLIEMGGLVLRAATQSAIFSAGFAGFAIFIAEWQQLRDWLYYAIIGGLIALGGFLAQYASENAAEPTIWNNYALAAFMTSGGVGGLIYWMFAGRHAGRRRRPAWLQAADEEVIEQSAPTGEATGQKRASHDGSCTGAQTKRQTAPQREASGCEAVTTIKGAGAMVQTPKQTRQ